MTFLGRKSVDG